MIKMLLCYYRDDDLIRVEVRWDLCFADAVNDICVL